MRFGDALLGRSQLFANLLIARFHILCKYIYDVIVNLVIFVRARSGWT